MINFKLFKEKIQNSKWFTKTKFMDKSTDKVSKTNSISKSSKSPTQSSNKQMDYETINSEGFIPLVARDSLWVGIEFYNPNFHSTLYEEEDTPKSILYNSAIDDTDPFSLLFPGLNLSKCNLLKENESSTTEITKLLIGQKADFNNIKASRKLSINENKLTSVPEVAQEEKLQSETDISTCSTRKINSISDSGNENYDDDDDKEPKRTTHIKRRKKKSDIRVMPLEVSSISILVPHKRNSSKFKQPLPSSEFKVEKSDESCLGDIDERTRD